MKAEVLAPGTALIADDDAFFRMALNAMLSSKLGFEQVQEADSLDQALELLAADAEISLALFDLAMPGMESAANLRAVRDCYPTLRIAVVSASRRRQDILAALDAGVHGYVPKQLGVLELPKALSLIVEGFIYVPPSLARLPGPEVDPLPVPSAHEVHALTPRQTDVLRLLVQGASNKAIARTLGLGEGTIKVHMAALFRSLGVSSRAAAAAAGARFLGPESDL